MPTSDATWGLLGWLRGVAVGGILRMRVETDPSPTHRPRVAKFGTYYAKPYQRYHADCVKQFAIQKGGTPLTGPLAAAVEIIVKKPKTTKLFAPRGDVDNHAKGCLDAATKAGVWGDDGQLVCIGISKRFAVGDEPPGVVMHVGPVAP